MRIRTYRDAAHSHHVDLVGGGDHPWSVDLIAEAVSLFLIVGFACAVIAVCIG
jgi:hypothetical protein